MFIPRQKQVENADNLKSKRKELHECLVKAEEEEQQKQREEKEKNHFVRAQGERVLELLETAFARNAEKVDSDIVAVCAFWPFFIKLS